MPTGSGSARRATTYARLRLWVGNLPLLNYCAKGAQAYPRIEEELRKAGRLSATASADLCRSCDGPAR
jgi:hypothetical protein